jgi:hypothetical protein
MRSAREVHMGVHRTIGVATGVAALLFAAAPAAAAPADGFTEHNIVQFTDDAFVGPCDGSLGTLTVDGQEVLHVTDTGRTFRLSSTLRGMFSVDFDDPAVADVAGHFVSHHRETVNYAQLKDARVTDSIRSVAVSTDGTSLPVQTTFTVLFGADGSVEVKVDSTRCGGERID